MADPTAPHIERAMVFARVVSTLLAGYCQCGCGGKTSVAPANDAKAGIRKGEYRRWLKGHNARKYHSPVEYIEDPDSGCWVWQHACFGTGYGRRGNPDGTSVSAHRWYYEQAKGPIPEGLHIDHLCRNPKCVNPDHLEPVTCAENIRRGANTRLSDDEVVAIREAPGTQAEIGRRFGVSRAYVGDLRRGKHRREAA